MALIFLENLCILQLRYTVEVWNIRKDSKMFRLLTSLGIFRFSDPQISGTSTYISSPNQTKLIQRNKKTFFFFQKLINLQLVKFNRILWNHKLYNRFHNSPSFVPICSQINPLYAPNLMSLRSILVFPSHPPASKPSPVSIYRFYHAFHMPLLPYSLYDHLTLQTPS